MTIEEAYKIIEEYDRWEDLSCSCYLGKPICERIFSVNKEKPSEDDYNEAVKCLKDEYLI
jgi:hypothetical protein